MGCDIHVHTEKLIILPDGEEKWINTDWFQQSERKVLYNDPDDPDFEIVTPYDAQNYYLFSIIAGVRGHVPDEVSLGPRRGLPHDCDELTIKQFHKDEDHSATWFTLKELQKYYRRMKKAKHLIPEDPEDENEDSELQQEYLLQTFKTFLKAIKKKAITDLNIEFYKVDPALLKQQLNKVASKYRVVIWFDS